MEDYFATKKQHQRMPCRSAAMAAGATTTRPPTTTTSTTTTTTPLPEDPLPFPGIALGVAKYQKFWARGAAADTRPQYVDALVSPTTGHAYIKSETSTLRTPSLSTFAPSWPWTTTTWMVA